MNSNTPQSLPAGIQWLASLGARRPKPKLLRTTDVFRENAYELPYTYVARTEVEADLAAKLSHNIGITLMHGPSKSGKTVLATRHAGDLPKVHIHAYSKMSADEFWETLRQAIQAPGEVVLTNERERTLTRMRGGRGALIGPVELELSGSSQTTIGETFATSIKLEMPGRPGVLAYLRRHPHLIVIDDFHWMSDAIKEDIFPPLKQSMAQGSKVTLISVSKNAFPQRGDYGDFVGRSMEVEIPHWTKGELAQIAWQGFPLLGVRISEKSVEYLTDISYHSPLLMQGLCAHLCLENTVFETQARPVTLTVQSRAEAGALAGRFAKSITSSFDSIVDAEANRTWQTKKKDGGRKISLAEITILGISHAQLFAPMSLRQIVARLEERVLCRPTPANLSSLVVQKILDIQKRFGGARMDRSPIYYEHCSKTVTVVDPYFKLWARWVRGPELGGKLFD